MKYTIIVALFILFCTGITYSCVTPATIAAKSGAQLWGENCQRCHNVPPPNAFEKNSWDVIGTHMKVKANLTVVEEDKIVEFLKSAN